MSTSTNALFAKILAVILGIIAIFTGGNLNNVTVTVTSDMTTESTKLEYELANYSGRSISLDDDYLTLEMKQGDEWVEVIPDVCFQESALKMPNLDTVSMSLDLGALKGETLAAGEYRLTKEFSTTSAKGSCSTTFTVTQA